MLTASLIVLIAGGLVNGSFVIPARYIKATGEKVWLYHSIIGVILIPWIFLFAVSGGAGNYFLLKMSEILFLIAGGLVFGCGQLCFAQAIDKIGIALSFTINIGLGVTIGSLFVALEKGVLFSRDGFLVTLAVCLILVALVLYYFAGRNRVASRAHDRSYHLGWGLSILAGFASGLQNIVFVMVAFESASAIKTSNSFWVWPLFLLAAAIPMFFGFMYRLRKNRAAIPVCRIFDLSWRSVLLVVVMGLFFSGSLVLYSKGMSQLSQGQQIIGWPMFMVAIILTSQFWGVVYRTAQSNITSKVLQLISVVLLISAIVILAITQQ